MKNLLDNKFISGLLLVFVSVYASLIAPNLPKPINNLLDTIVGRIVILFLIGFASSNNVELSLIIAILYVITLQYLNKENFKEHSKKVKKSKKSKQLSGGKWVDAKIQLKVHKHKFKNEHSHNK